MEETDEFEVSWVGQWLGGLVGIYGYSGMALSRGILYYIAMGKLVEDPLPQLGRNLQVFHQTEKRNNNDSDTHPYTNYPGIDVWT